MSPDDVQGTTDPAFASVRTAFESVLAADTTEPGAQLAVYVNRRRTVDLWAGDGISGDTLTGLMSVSKGAAYLVTAGLVEEGVLNLDRPVRHYWPEFTGAGKDTLTVRQLLEHRSGLIGVDGGFIADELADDHRMADRLAPQQPFWEPGTGYGYHALVIGALIGEVIRRATGRSIQQLYEERIRSPYNLDFYLGLPDALESRYAAVRPMVATAEQRAYLESNPVDPRSFLAIAFGFNATPPIDLPALANARRTRELGSASLGGVGNARGVAELYATAIGELGSQKPLLKPATIAEFSRWSTPGADLVTGQQDHFGVGFEIIASRFPSAGKAAFGHCGAAGSLGFADPQARLAYAYVRRRFAFPGGAAEENGPLIEAVMAAANAAR
jgi:CubicO group peptidase (beta-lactamase class C family)